MDLSSLMFWKKKPIKEVPINEAGQKTSGQITQANIQNFVVKAVGNIEQTSTTDFESPKTDLNEIHDAIAADSYIKLAVSKYAQLIFKAGYNIVSSNDSAAEYIRGRFRMMSFRTGNPIDVTFQQIADDLVAYSNAFLIKSRIDMTNIGGLQAKGIYDTKPVGGYFRVAPTTMQIKRDKNGAIKNYQQQVGNEKKSYKPTEVVHFYIDKAGGEAFGTPRIVAALEDVKILRKIEGNVLKLIYRYAMPIVQMKIGIPEAGLMATDKEIKEARSEIEKLSDDGILITNERTEFNSLGAEGEALNAAPYLSYFEQRVFAALCLSNSQVGRGGAKQDANSMEEQVHDTVKRYQRAIRVFIEEKIINELLLEGGFNPLMDEHDIVRFQFNEINLDTKVKMQTHALNQFQGNAISFEEMRQQMGLRADNVDEKRLYQNMVITPAQLALIAAKSGTSGSTSANVGASGPSKTNLTKGTIKNIISPQNQHGATTAIIKEANSIDITESSTEENIENYKKNFNTVYKKYLSMRNDICDDGQKAAIVLPLSRDSILKNIENYVIKNAKDGSDRALKDSKKSLDSAHELPSSILMWEAKKVLTSMFKDIEKKLKSCNTREDREKVFNSMEYRLRFLMESIASKAYWFGYAKTCSYLKIPKIYVSFGKSDDKKEHEAVVHTDHFSLDDIPPFHAYCSCRLGTEKEKAGEKT